MKEYFPWILTGLVGIFFMFTSHVLMIGDLSNLEKTDISGKNVVLSGILSSILCHIGAAASGDKEVIGWAIVTVPMLGFYSVVLNALIAAIFNTIVYETNKRKPSSSNQKDAPDQKAVR